MTAHPRASRSPGLRFEVAPDLEAMSRRAAALIESALRRKPALLLCAAAGSSPARTYELLGERASQDPALFRRLRVIKVDEWGGLNLADPATCESDLRTRLLVPLRIAPDRYQGFDSQPADPPRECERISQWLARNGPIDLCVLGVGANGHLAMNEPARALCPGPHIAQLAPGSLQHPMLAVSNAKPAYGLTLGLRDILQSRKILLLAGGERKRAVLERLRQPRLTPLFPASFLWLHPDTIVLSDEKAEGGLS
ncbi:MAG: 6-phosphogluconolactonase [Verrucomicrobiota bacterium]|jgi:galactosamine-6-phosphate isomerase